MRITTGARTTRRGNNNSISVKQLSRCLERCKRWVLLSSYKGLRCLSSTVQCSWRMNGCGYGLDALFYPKTQFVIDPSRFIMVFNHNAYRQYIYWDVLSLPNGLSVLVFYRNAKLSLRRWRYCWSELVTRKGSFCSLHAKLNVKVFYQ
jgi:hypothetical protein